MSTADPALMAATPRAMSLWRLEILRLFRTHRWIALFGVYLAFGLLGPVTATYLPDILTRVQSEMTIIVPPPQPKDGMTNYINQVGQTGVIVVVAIAAGALAFDAHPGVSIFLRTRATGMWSLIRPRVTVTLAAAIAAYALGTLAVWYGTAVLLGPLPAGSMAAGLLCAALYLTFVIAVVAAAASLTRGTLGTVGLALITLLLLAIAGSVAPLHDWLPSSLVAAPANLLTGATLVDFLPAMAVAVVASAGLVAGAVWRLGRREI